MNSKKIILPLIAAILLSIGVISFVSAQGTTTGSFLEELYKTVGINQDASVMGLSVYSSTSDAFEKTIQISEGKVEIGGKLCVGETCVDTLEAGEGAWDEENNSVYWNGGVGIGASEENRDAYVTIQNNGIPGVGLWTMVTSNNVTLTLTPDAEEPAKFDSVAAGDTVVLTIDSEEIVTKVKNKTDSSLVVDVITNANLDNQSQSSEIEWKYVPNIPFTVKNNNGNNVMSIGEDGVIFYASLCVGDENNCGNAIINKDGKINASGDLNVTGELSALSANITGDIRVNDIYVTALGVTLSELFRIGTLGNHTFLECQRAGGIPYDANQRATTKPSEYKSCLISGSKCPDGWTRYENWMATREIVKKFDNDYCDPDYCTIPEFRLVDKPLTERTCTANRHVWKWYECVPSGSHAGQANEDDITEGLCI